MMVMQELALEPEKKVVDLSHVEIVQLRRRTLPGVLLLVRDCPLIP